MSTIPEEILARIEQCRAINSNLLDLYGCGLDVLSSELIGQISQLQNLTQLYLGRNNLGILPPEIVQLQNLTLLSLADNNLSTLPLEIAQLQNLTLLSLADNSFSTLPTEITQLQNLELLDLSANQLSTLPLEITQLQNLTQLDLSNNQFSTLLPEIIQLQNLTWLDLKSNQLSMFPLEITQLQNLAQLDLRNNQLSTLPLEIVQLENLKQLNLHGNPLTIPPQEILEPYKKGEITLEELLAYFHQLAKEGIDVLYEAKLLIIGEGGAGKTSLARRIQAADRVLPKEEETTHGIDIQSWSFPIDNEQKLRVNIWDFGGQQIYHATHQFFLTKRSLYVLVADDRKEDTPFYDWLNRAELFGGDSPVLIVKNRRAGRTVDLDAASLKARFDNLKEILDCDILHNEGRDALLKEICYRLQQLPHIGQTLPKTWAKVREVLEADSRHTISRDDYLKICEQHGFTRRKDALQLSEYLHDLGVFLHFQDDPLLAKTLILTPTWATDAVYKVLDDSTIKANHGRFNRDELDALWHEADYAEFRDELLQLMMKFALCYALPMPREYIAPQLLSRVKIDYLWDSKNNLQLRYDYPRFMPSGILSRFIVALHERIEDERRRVWRHGVVLHDGETRAEVIEDLERRQIRLRLSGPGQRDFLVLLVEELEKIHKTLHDLEYVRRVPCNCVECVNSGQPHFFRYQALKNFQLKGRPLEIPCEISGEMVQVHDLLDNIKDSALSRVTPQDVEAREAAMFGQQEQDVETQYNAQNIHIHNHSPASPPPSPQADKPETPTPNPWYFRWEAISGYVGIGAGSVSWFLLASFKAGLVVAIITAAVMLLLSPNRRFFRAGMAALTTAIASVMMPSLRAELEGDNTMLGITNYAVKFVSEYSWEVTAMFVATAIVLFWLDSRMDK